MLLLNVLRKRKGCVKGSSLFEIKRHSNILMRSVILQHLKLGPQRITPMVLKDLVRQKVTKLLSLFGIHGRHLGLTFTSQRFTVQSAFHHNTAERMNQFYTNPENVKNYLSLDRVRFYQTLIVSCRTRGIDCNGKRIADVGCGAGYLLRVIHETSNPQSLTGFEHSEEAIKMAKTLLPEASFHCCDIYKGTNLKFDLVFCTEVLEHLLYPDRAVRALLGMIDKQGAVLMTVPNGRTDNFEGHINFWSPESWEVFIRNCCNTFEVETGLLETGANFAIVKWTEDGKLN